MSVFSPQILDTIRENDKVLLPKVEGTPLLDSLALSFLQNINNLLAVGVLARARRAVLMNAKVMDLSYFKILLLIISFASLKLLVKASEIDLLIYFIYFLFNFL